MLARIAVAIALATAACATAETAVDDSAAALTDGTAEAFGVLALLNDPRTTEELLDVDVGLDARAARNLIAARPFPSITAVDDVRWVGPAALDRLTAYALDHGWVPAGDDVLGVFDGVPFTVNEAIAVLDLANTAPASVLRDDVPLDRRAVDSILAARPVATMPELAELYYVGSAMLQRLKAFAAPPARELGLISDLDKTVIPPEAHAPYAGVATLYAALEGDVPGDVYYVTARPDTDVVDIPAWLAAHAVPAGPIATGISPILAIARDEKVRDIAAILDANPDQRFVLIGDTNHADPDAYREILARYPDRVVAAFVHDVKPIAADRLHGLTLFTDYAEVAAALTDLAALDPAVADAIAAELAHCHPVLVSGLRACAAEQRADGLPDADARQLCADAELVGPAYDAMCAADAGAPMCALSYEAFYLDALPACLDALGW